jgi:two-component system, LytTR family, response regulator
MPHRALLVDDERLARSQLRSLLEDFPEIEVVAEADCVSKAVEAVDACSPDVVFLDIQMPTESGFEFLEKARCRFQVIFVTAYDQHAIRAFEVNGLDYLLKPIEKQRLSQAIRRISPTGGPGGKNTRLAGSDYLFVSSTYAARFLQVKKIQFILAAGAYSEIFAADGSKWIMLRSMKEWQEQLAETQFARIHRSAIVNLDFVERIEALANYSYRVFLRGTKTPLWMSRRQGLLLKEKFG